MARKCVFCDIIAQTASAHIVCEDDISIGFLDTRPLFPGHVLLVPREHCETLPDLPTPSVAPFFENVQTLSKAVPLATDAEGSFIAVNNKVSQSVPHPHVHIVPRNKKDGLRKFFWPRTGYTDGQHTGATRDCIIKMLQLI